MGSSRSPTECSNFFLGLARSLTEGCESELGSGGSISMNIRTLEIDLPSIYVSISKQRINTLKESEVPAEQQDEVVMQYA